MNVLTVCAQRHTLLSFKTVRFICLLISAGLCFTFSSHPRRKICLFIPVMESRYFTKKQGRDQSNKQTEVIKNYEAGKKQMAASRTTANVNATRKWRIKTEKINKISPLLCRGIC